VVIIILINYLYLDFQFQALGETSEENLSGVSDLHFFWQKVFIHFV
jgi:hypothetical protein